MDGNNISPKNVILISGPFSGIIRDVYDVINVDTTLGAVDLYLQNIKQSNLLYASRLVYINDVGLNLSVNNLTIFGSLGDLVNNSLSIIVSSNGANLQCNVATINEWTVSGLPASGGGTVTSADNGLSLVGTVVKLGGSLLAPTAIDASSNPFTIIDSFGTMFQSRDANGNFILGALGTPIVINSSYIFSYLSDSGTIFTNSLIAIHFGGACNYNNATDTYSFGDYNNFTNTSVTLNMGRGNNYTNTNSLFLIGAYNTINNTYNTTIIGQNNFVSGQNNKFILGNSNNNLIIDGFSGAINTLPTFSVFSTDAVNALLGIDSLGNIYNTGINTSSLVAGSGTINHATIWTATGLGDGTWYFSGNDYLPVTTGSNLGDATHRIGTIFMASVFDYSNDLTWFNGTSSTMALTTAGNLGLGTVTPSAKLHIKGDSNLSTDFALKVDNSASSPLLYVRNDGHIMIMDMIVGRGGGLSQYNTVLGVSALISNSTGTRNTALGYLSLSSNITGASNTSIGYSSLSQNLADFNTAIGSNTLISNTTGTGNTAIGVDALVSNTIGINNIAIGANSGGQGTLASNVNGSYNIAIGTYALNVQNSVNGSVAIGSASLYSNISGQFNTAVGYESLRVSLGSGNTAFGFNSGRNHTGSNNTFLGYGADSSLDGLVNATAIGYNSTVSTSNALILGSGANIGIGTNSPTAKAHILGIDATSANYALKVDNSAGAPLLYVRNNQIVTIKSIGGFTADVTLGVAGFTHTYGWKSRGYNKIEYGINDFVTGDARPMIEWDNSASPSVFLTGLINDDKWGIYAGSGWQFSVDKNTGNVGIGTENASAELHIRGIDSTSSNYALKVDNSASTNLFSVRNDGQVNSLNGYSFNGNRILQGDSASTNVFLGYYDYNNPVVNSGIAVTAIGYNAGSNNSGTHVIGIGAETLLGNSGGYSIGLGYSTLKNNSGSSVFAFGYYTASNNSGSNVLAFGNNSAQNNTLSNVAIFGKSATGGGVGYLDFYIGTGIDRTNETIHYVNLRQGTAKVGELNKDMSAAPFNIVGAVGTGTGLGGNIVFKVAKSGLSGTAQNTLIDALIIQQDGNIGFNGTSFGSGVGVLFKGFALTVPTTNPIAGVVDYVENVGGGVQKYRDTNGTIVAY